MLLLLPLEIGVFFRKRIRYVGSANIKDTWSTGKYEVIGLPPASGGQHIVRKVGKSGLAARIVWHELKRC